MTLRVSRVHLSAWRSPIQAAKKNRLPHSGGGNAYQLVIFQVALGALLINVLMSCELRGDLIIRRGKGLDMLSTP